VLERKIWKVNGELGGYLKKCLKESIKLEKMHLGVSLLQKMERQIEKWDWEESTGMGITKEPISREQQQQMKHRYIRDHRLQ
jgi:hypothetical protein